MLALLLAAATGAGTVWTAFQYHVVRTDQKLLLVSKRQADWREAWIDVRGWSFREWGAHPELSQNMIAAGHGDLVARSATDDLFRGLLDSFRDRGSTESRETPPPSR